MSAFERMTVQASNFTSMSTTGPYRESAHQTSATTQQDGPKRGFNGTAETVGEREQHSA